MNDFRILFVSFVIGIGGIGFSHSAESGIDELRWSGNGAISNDALSSVVAIDNAEKILRASLQLQHASKFDYPALSEKVVRSFGWTPERIRNYFLTTALDSGELQQIRGRALYVYMELSRDHGIEQVVPLFSDPDDAVRRSALMLSLGKMTGAKEGLSFFSNQIDRLKAEKQFRRDVYALSGHFHGIVHYKFVPEGDVEDIILFYRDLSDSPPFAECAVIADSFLARFDSQWTNSTERRILLERWKDSPELGDYPRDSLQKAYVQEIAEQNDSSGKSGSDGSAVSAASAESGLSPEPPSIRRIWIVGVAALLAVALVLVFRRNRR